MMSWNFTYKCLLHPVMVYVHAGNTLDAEHCPDTCHHGGYEVAAVAEFGNGAANSVAIRARKVSGHPNTRQLRILELRP